MVGDLQFTCPVSDFAYSYAEAGDAIFKNAYVYHFSERASNSPWPTWSGVIQGDEIPFVFGAPLDDSKNFDQSEVKLSKRMMAYWANFAKTG